MGFFDRFPYSNPYQLNLDWIIAQMRKFEADYNQLDPDSFLRKSGGLVDGVLQMAENGAIDMSGKPLTGLKTAVNSGDALPFGQAEGLYLHKAGDRMSGALDMNGHNITGLEMPVGDADAATKQYVDLKIGTPEEPGAYLPLAGGMMSGDLNMDGHALTGIQNPINGLDAVNKTFVDGVNGDIRQWALGQFAPSGFGLGSVAKSLDDIADISALDNITHNGWYSFRIPAGEWVNNVFVDYAYMRVDNYDLTGVTQTVYCLNNTRTILTRDTVGGVWGKWKSPNPPMVAGVEYLTTRYWRDKPLYTKLVDLGIFPSNSQKIVNYVESGVVDEPVNWYGVYANQQCASGNEAFLVTVTKTSIVINPKGVTEGYTSQIAVEYTKV